VEGGGKFVKRKKTKKAGDKPALGQWKKNSRKEGMSLALRTQPKMGIGVLFISTSKKTNDPLRKNPQSPKEAITKNGTGKPCKGGLSKKEWKRARKKKKEQQ